MTGSRKLSLTRDSLTELTVGEMTEVRGLSISCPIVRLKKAAEAFIAAVSAEIPTCPCPIET